MKYKIKNPGPTKKPIAIIVALVVVLLLLLLCGLVYRHQTTNTADRQTGTDSESLDLGPPTEEEKTETEQHKESLSNQESDTQTPASDGKKQVTPIITSASKSKVRAYVSGVIEEGGSCAFVFTKGSTTFKKETNGFQNVGVTNCEPAELAPADFVSSGTWSVTLSYSSNIYEGKSQPVSFEVP